MRTLVYSVLLNLLACGVCFSQGLQLEYEYPGEWVSTTYQTWGDPIIFPGFFDLNGDGKDEIVIRVGGDVDQIVFIEVSNSPDLTNYTEIWSYSSDGPTEISFGGCVDFAGDGSPEVLIYYSGGDIEVVEYPGGANVASLPRGSGGSTAGVYDFDEDGLPEIIYQAPTGVQIWGWHDGTGVPEIAWPRGTLPQNHPNPFNPQTTIEFQVQSAGEVRIEILDLRGRLIRTLVRGFKQVGDHEVVWDGADESGRQQASGSYLYVLHVGDFSASRKMLLLK